MLLRLLLLLEHNSLRLHLLLLLLLLVNLVLMVLHRRLKQLKANMNTDQTLRSKSTDLSYLLWVMLLHDWLLVALLLVRLLLLGMLLVDWLWRVVLLLLLGLGLVMHLHF